MTITHWLVTWAASLAAFLVIDLTWLGVVARDLYRSRMGSLLAEQPNWIVAAAFYALYVAGVLYFAVNPALGDGGWQHALRDGALLGLLAYATYDLTSLAVVRGYPGSLAIIDIAWGVVLTGIVAVTGWRVATWLGGA